MSPSGIAPVTSCTATCATSHCAMSCYIRYSIKSNCAKTHKWTIESFEIEISCQLYLEPVIAVIFSSRHKYNILATDRIHLMTVVASWITNKTLLTLTFFSYFKFWWFWYSNIDSCKSYMRLIDSNKSYNRCNQ